MTATELDFDCELTVHDIVTRHPATAAVFTRFGLDTCCGATLTVKESAYRENVDTTVLCTELREAARKH